MLLLHDRATMAHAFTLDLDSRLLTLLAHRVAALSSGEHDLTEWTEYLIVQRGDTEADIVREVGFSPLVEPIDGARFPASAFRPHWDWLADHGGWFEMIITVGNSGFAFVLFIEDGSDPPDDLLILCRRYTDET